MANAEFISFPKEAYLFSFYGLFVFFILTKLGVLPKRTSSYYFNVCTLLHINSKVS